MNKNELSAAKIKEQETKVEKIIKALRKLFPNPKIALRYSNNWELFVAVVLSAQCTDKKVNEVTEKLFKQYRKLEDYIKAKQKDFESVRK